MRDVKAGEAAVRAGDTDGNFTDNPQVALVDTIANLRHWADKYDIDFATAFDEATDHYLMELNIHA